MSDNEMKENISYFGHIAKFNNYLFLLVNYAHIFF